jgi:hypothetical protein
LGEGRCCELGAVGSPRGLLLRAGAAAVVVGAAGPPAIVAGAGRSSPGALDVGFVEVVLGRDAWPEAGRQGTQLAVGSEAVAGASSASVRSTVIGRRSRRAELVIVAGARSTGRTDGATADASARRVLGRRSRLAGPTNTITTAAVSATASNVLAKSRRPPSWSAPGRHTAPSSVMRALAPVPSDDSM